MEDFSYEIVNSLIIFVSNELNDDDDKSKKLCCCCAQKIYFAECVTLLLFKLLVLLLLSFRVYKMHKSSNVNDIYHL